MWHFEFTMISFEIEISGQFRSKFRKKTSLKETNQNCSTGSLCCDTAEEAKTLIPSLQDKIGDDELQELLDEITKLMGYIN